MAELELLEGGTAESRATSILISLFGFAVVVELLVQEDIWDSVLKMMTTELEIVAEYRFTTMPAAPDCREMTPEETVKALPGLITWGELQMASEKPNLRRQVAFWKELALADVKEKISANAIEG